jgi:hypothetical protein
MHDQTGSKAESERVALVFVMLNTVAKVDLEEFSTAFHRIPTQ